MFEAIGGIIGGIFGTALGQSRESRHAAERMKAFREGKLVRLPCAMRYEGESFWRHGDLMISKTESAWVPPKMNSRKVALPRTDIVITSVRNPTLHESMDVNPSSLIMLCELGKQKIHLAIPRESIGPVRATFRFPPGSARLTQ